MIRILMLGRTGNNLFQYAVGRALSERLGEPLVMDGSWFNRAGWQSVSQIRQLPLKAKLVRDPTPASRMLRKLISRHRWEFLGKPIYRENKTDVSYDPTVLDLPSSPVLFGYFQSHRYFSHIEPLLRREIHFHDRKLDAPSAEWAGKITSTASVAIHIRRTDYIGNPNTDVCDDRYYADAIDRIRATVDDPEFFIFSDDPEWCRERYKAPGFHIVDVPVSKRDPLNDLHLMSLAGHHIIANSSYSWWAAWIGKKENQKVLIPDPWLVGIRSPMEDRLLEGWESIPSASENPVVMG